MTRERWLVLAGCLALLPFFPACANTCLNPQPEPPGGGCNEATSSIRPPNDSGAGNSFLDARSAADAGPDGAGDAALDDRANPRDGGADQADRADGSLDDAPDDAADDAAPETSSDGEGGAPSDAPEDGPDDAPDALPDAGAVDGSSDALIDGADGVSNDDAGDGSPPDGRSQGV